jgi:hypothetical protein
LLTHDLEALAAKPQSSARSPLRRATSALAKLLRRRIAAKAICTAKDPLRADAEAENQRDSAPAQTGRRKQVSETRRHQRIEQILSRKESTSGKPIPCAAWSDPRGEA